MEQERLTQSQGSFFIYDRKKILTKISFSYNNYADLKKTNEKIITVTNADIQPLKETFALSSVVK
jgi:hypothetical protein